MLPVCFISSAYFHGHPGAWLEAYMLTERQVKNAREKERDYKLAVSGGLYPW